MARTILGLPPGQEDAEMRALGGASWRCVVWRGRSGRDGGDLFNDGNVDVVIENIDGVPMLLRNHGVSGAHWIGFELAGTKSNRLGIGARLKIVTNGIIQTGDVRSGGSYLSQSDLRVHFGLGSAVRVDEVEIRWPSGMMDVLKNLDADKFYFVMEGKGQVSASSIRPDVPARK